MTESPGVRQDLWNTWTIDGKESAIYPMIEIPFERDITTVVGANESGKSHLLSAISKVINGKGVPGDPFSQTSEGDPYSQTDMCHFAAVLSKNLEEWPHVGLEFGDLTSQQLSSILQAVGKTTNGNAQNISVFLMPTKDSVGRLYVGTDNEPILLSQQQLDKVKRSCQPLDSLTLRFQSRIKSCFRTCLPDMEPELRHRSAILIPPRSRQQDSSTTSPRREA